MNEVVTTGTLPEAFGTVFEYRPTARSGRLLFLAAQAAKTDAVTMLATGRCGAEVDFETAKRCAEGAADQAMAWIENSISKSEVLSNILRVTYFLAVNDEFDQMSDVADAGSRRFIAFYGDKGSHCRSVVGVSRLPRNTPVAIEVTVEITSSDEHDAE
ncbi:MAG: RidA family protein [Rhodospirillaceae bacterium]|jgi:enamine deaminase RidA (YjgF/YER057c/UK114 family)|nr:RidA family protein [Rhodospirillaceae bacterium]